MRIYFGDSSELFAEIFLKYPLGIPPGIPSGVLQEHPSGIFAGISARTPFGINLGIAPAIPSRNHQNISLRIPPWFFIFHRFLQVFLRDSSGLSSRLLLKLLQGVLHDLLFKDYPGNPIEISLEIYSEILPKNSLSFQLGIFPDFPPTISWRVHPWNFFTDYC